MRRTVSITVLALLASIIALLITGCFSARIHLKVNPNGSAEVDLLMYAPRPLMIFSETSGLFNEIRNDLSGKGFSVENYDEGDQVGFRAFRKADSPDDFFSPGSEDFFTFCDIDSLKVEQGFFKNRYSIETGIDLGQLGRYDPGMTPLSADIRFLLTLPVRPSGHNAHSVSEDGKTLEWILQPGGSNRIQVMATAPGIGALLLLLLLAPVSISTIITLRALRRRRR